MRRFRGGSRRRGTSRKSRKTRWVGGFFQGQTILFSTGSPASGAPYSWVSAWAKWPAGEEDPQTNRVEPSDETLVRALVRSSITIVTGNNMPTDYCVGLIAFDGGEFPEFYEGATFTSNVSLVAPPNPISDADDDWIIRQPYLATSATDLMFTFPSLEERAWTESRAMRKLPPNTGVLIVIGAQNLLLAAPPVATLNFSVDARLAVRSGYTA